MTLPLNPPPRRIIAEGPTTAHPDTLRAIANHLVSLNTRINRLSQAHDRVLDALKSEPPPGVSRIDWIARMLNEEH